MTDEYIPMFHVRRNNFSPMHWMLIAFSALVLIFGFYTIYDLRRVTASQLLEISKLTTENEALRQKVGDVGDEKSKLAKLMDKESTRQNALIQCMNVFL